MRIGSFIGVAIACGLAGCAPAATGTTHSLAGAGQATNVTYGTIVAERRGRMGSFAGDGIRSDILAALGGASGEPASRAVRGADGTTEFIVREDDGRIVSVMQGGMPHVAIGGRVTIMHGIETRLVPTGRDPR